MKLSLALCLSLLTAGSALAQNASLQDRALAAGYKAMFTCSATFNSGKTTEQISTDELDNIYPDFASGMQAIGETRIDASAKIVTVEFDENMPPRFAAWRKHLGCTALPQGASKSAVKYLPRVKLRSDKRDMSSVPWPMGDQLPNTSPPKEVDSDGLEATIGRAFKGEFKGATTSVLVMQNGRILGERYREGWDKDTSQRTWSVAKSIGASIIGAAVEDDILDVTDKAGLEAWSRKGDPRAEITVEHLLQMASGLHSDPEPGKGGNRTDQVYFGGGLMAQQATRNPLEAPPGARWKYANNDTMLAVRSLREAMDNDRKFHAYPFKSLLHPIGMYNTVPETDWGGDFILSSQVWTTARDLGRLGQLYLDDGVWTYDGKPKRILPEGWADYVAAPASAQPANRQGKAATEPGRGYGAQFWRYENYPGVPNDTYAALGNRGQFLIIVPSKNVVIVRRGYDWRGNYFDGPKFVAEVLESLD
ncbi:MAG: serine hydrolase [Litorimonas sp.]